MQKAVKNIELSAKFKSLFNCILPMSILMPAKIFTIRKSIVTSISLGWYHNIYQMYQLWKVMCAFIKMSKSFTASLSKYTNNLLLYLHRKAFKMPTIIMFNQFVAHSFLIFCVLFARRCSLFAKNIDHTFNKQCKICTKTIRAERKTQIIIWKLIMSSFFYHTVE